MLNCESRLGVMSCHISPRQFVTISVVYGFLDTEVWCQALLRDN